MTLKYESEILLDLMKRDGVSSPSDVLPYESELKEKYLNQVVGAYPKLQDYRPEWLNYNLCHYIPSEFPIESVTNVTNASFHDVVPYTYKSAILKGQTLVNLVNDAKNTENKWTVYGEATIDENGVWHFASDIAIVRYAQQKIPVKNNTTYTAFLKCKNKNTNETNMSIGLYLESTDGGSRIASVQENILSDDFIMLKCKITTTTHNSITFRLHARGLIGEAWFKEPMLVEGDYTNVDIPYFEGMQSVKMPVLTTSNEDGTKTNILTVNEDVTLRGIGDVKDELDCLTGEVTERIGEVVLDGSEAWKLDTIYTEYPRYVLKLENSCSSLNRQPIISEYFPYAPSDHVFPSAFIFESNLYVYLEKTTTIDELRAFLQSNPVTLQYPVATDSVKTVDLSCINEQGKSETFRPIEGTMHVSTSSQTLLPLLDMIVPVEATTQNLMSFANIIEEE